MTRLQLLAELLYERYGEPPVLEAYAKPSPPPLRRVVPEEDSSAKARPWVCVCCFGPAHPERPGWRCPVCGFSAFQAAPEVERGAA